MEKKISDLMDFLQDDSVALAPRGVASSVKIKEAVMEKLHMEKSTVKARPKLTRTALIAAVVAMVLSVAAFAVYRYSLRYLVSSVPEDGKTTLTLSGYQDSNEYRAAEEWEKYLRQTYASGEADQPEDESLPLAYRDLGAQSGEMAAMLQQTAGRYGLTLPQNEQPLADVNALCKALGIGAFLPAEPSDGSFERGAVLYDTGSFRMVDAAALQGGLTLRYQLYRSVKGCFTRAYNLFAEPNDFEEWEYTTAKGTPVTLAIGKNKSLLTANMDGSFVFVNILSGTENGDSQLTSYGAQKITKPDLEAFADSIDFAALNKQH